MEAGIESQSLTNGKDKTTVKNLLGCISQLMKSRNKLRIIDRLYIKISEKQTKITAFSFDVAICFELMFMALPSPKQMR